MGFFHLFIFTFFTFPCFVSQQKFWLLAAEMPLPTISKTTPLSFNCLNCIWTGFPIHSKSLIKVFINPILLFNAFSSKMLNTWNSKSNTIFFPVYVILDWLVKVVISCLLDISGLIKGSRDCIRKHNKVITAAESNMCNVSARPKFWTVEQEITLILCSEDHLSGTHPFIPFPLS